MRRSGFSYRNIIICGFFASVLNGCISVGQSPEPRLYMLKQEADSGVVQEFIIPSDIITVIGPVEIPQYLDRPQMVTQENGMMNVAQFDRWGESLDTAISRLIIEDLGLMVKDGTFEMFPCSYSIPVKYQVIISIQQLESDLKKGIYFVAQWSIIDAASRKMLFAKRSSLMQPIDPHNYSGLAQALSKVVALLSYEIAENLSVLAN